MMPSGVYATRRPASARGAPSQPFGASRVVSVMPATAVGSANGRSIRASIRRRPGTRYRVRVQAMIRPIGTLISEAARAVKKETRSAASTRGVVTASRKPSGPSVAALRISAARGIRTMRLR